MDEGGLKQVLGRQPPHLAHRPADQTLPVQAVQLEGVDVAGGAGGLQGEGQAAAPVIEAQVRDHAQGQVDGPGPTVAGVQEMQAAGSGLVGGEGQDPAVGAEGRLLHGPAQVGGEKAVPGLCGGVRQGMMEQLGPALPSIAQQVEPPS